MPKKPAVSFTAVIRKDDKMDVTYIDIDFDVEKTFGKKRLKVKVWYDNVLYRGLLTKYKGVYFLLINKEIRAQLGKNAGDTIRVKIEEDLDERTVELPQVMIDLFRKEPALKVVFDKMSYTHHREYVTWLTGAKKEETLQNRLIKFKELLRAKKDQIIL
ncbi:MAG: YdeI/OmpD-associated family protein [Chitinophagales bacterium]